MAEPRFEPADVNALVPELTRVMGGVRSAYEELLALRRARDAERRRLAWSGGGVLARADWERSAAAEPRLVEAVESGLEAVARLGGTVKDIALGLVDFPHQRAGQVVHLCWRLGEHAVGHWHGLDEGYAARRPL